jgi:transcriptional regulator with XRE-family HTH domain
MRDDPFKTLGDFLKSRRQRMTAKGATRRARRTPGLRREEIAEAAGIGVDWYTRLEQGRGGRPSPATLDGLAAALQLDRTEAAHLRNLATPAPALPFAAETAPPTLSRMIAGFTQPAYVTGRRWDVLAANAAARELFGGFAGAGAPPNIVAFALTDPAARDLFEDWPAQARRMVAQFRVAYDAFAGDPAFDELVARLRTCPGFDGWWDAHDVRTAPAGVKRLRHPRLGWTAYEYSTFQGNEDPAVKLTVYTPVEPQ